MFCSAPPSASEGRDERMLTQRRLSAEYMDDPAATRDEQATALRFLRMINARLGGAKAAIWHLKRWSPNWPRASVTRILDIGTGSADIPLAIARWAQNAGHRVHLTAVDRHPVTVELAREFIDRNGAAGEIEVMQCDALRLVEVFAPGSFDYAHAGLFLHHLPDIEVMTVLRMTDRLVRRGLIWNDLLRVPLPGVLLWPLLIGAPPKLKHDALVSVQAGFRKREAMDLAARAGLPAVRYRRHLLHRFTLTSEK
jgi:SAM-dependent methyltransferase